MKLELVLLCFIEDVGSSSPMKFVGIKLLGQFLGFKGIIPMKVFSFYLFDELRVLLIVYLTIL